MSVYIGVDPNNAAQVAHAASVNASEGQMQADTATATAKDASEGYITYAGVTYPDLPSAVRAISIAHYRRCYKSAIAQNISPNPYLDALTVLGVGPC